MMSRPGSERHRPRPSRARGELEVRMRIIRVKSVGFHHTRPPWPQQHQGALLIPSRAGLAGRLGGRLGCGLTGWQAGRLAGWRAQDRAAGQGRWNGGAAFRWLGCYLRRKWNGPAPKNEVPGDWPSSLAL